MMDVALNTGAVDANLAALFKFLLFGVADQVGIDHLPGGSRYGFYILVQRGFFKSFVCNTDAAKPAQPLTQKPRLPSRTQFRSRQPTFIEQFFCAQLTGVFHSSNS
jgi:hypothetical protein